MVRLTQRSTTAEVTTICAPISTSSFLIFSYFSNKKQKQHFKSFIFFIFFQIAILAQVGGRDARDGVSPAAAARGASEAHVGAAPLALPPASTEESPPGRQRTVWKGRSGTVPIRSPRLPAGIRGRRSLPRRPRRSRSRKIGPSWSQSYSSLTSSDVRASLSRRT